MKIYKCDVCGKKFGNNVSKSNASTYRISDFEIDSGFCQTDTSDADICTNCYHRIAKAQLEEISKIRKENNLK